MSLLDLDFAALDAYLKAKGIDTDAIGFYDHPAFLVEERKDRTFLELYGRFTQLRPRTPDYDAHVRSVVPRVANVLHRELVAEGRLGACVDLSQVALRILEREGVWAVMVSGALTISFPSHLRIPVTYFWPEDKNPAPGHVWVYAPPFSVVDLTLQQQPYRYQNIRPNLPAFVVAESLQPAKAAIEDIFSTERRASFTGPHRHDLRSKVSPHLWKKLEVFPAGMVRSKPASLKYVPCALSVSDGQLEDITNQRWNGRYGYEIYRDLIQSEASPP